MSMKLYPDIPARLGATILRDASVLLMIAVFAWFGHQTYEAIEGLTVLGAGVRQAGTSLQQTFDSAAGAVDAVPFVGSRLAGALKSTGKGTGGELIALGQQGVDRVRHLAVTLGLVVFALPTLLLLVLAIPGRVRQVRSLTAASVVLSSPEDLDRRRLVAMRAAFGLPYGTLLAYTRDPLGDLAAGRYDRLVDAALDDAGLRPRGARKLGLTPPGSTR